MGGSVHEGMIASESGHCQQNVAKCCAGVLVSLERKTNERRNRLETATRQQRPVTGFGAELYAVIYAHGMRSITELAKRFGDGKGAISRQALASYANGTRKVPSDLPKRIDEKLSLTEEERERLAYAMAWRQDLEN